jgi:ribonuclease P/MRP protein subunit POP1
MTRDSSAPDQTRLGVILLNLVSSDFHQRIQRSMLKPAPLCPKRSASSPQPPLHKARSGNKRSEARFRNLVIRKRTWTQGDLRFSFSMMAATRIADLTLQLLVPGTPLSPLRQDDRVPVLMIQRSLEPTCVNSNSEALHGWTLVLPAGWTMPLLSSLIYTGTRVGGQRERQTQAFESGLAYYPQDYPCTSAYARQAQDKEAEEKHKWEKTPKAKRANWSKLGTRSPWHADWEVVLGLKAAPEAAPDTVEDLVTTQREDPTVLKEPEEGDGSEKSRQAWLFCGPAAPDILESCCKIPDPPTGLLSEINRLRSKHHQHPLSDTTSADGLWNTALVMVRLTMHRRGVPSRLAAIYCLDDTELNKWRATDGTDEHSAAGVEVSHLVWCVDVCCIRH